MQNGNTCFGGTDIVRAKSLGRSTYAAQCRTSCAGSVNTTCGGGYANAVYTFTPDPPPMYFNEGCYTDTTDDWLFLQMSIYKGGAGGNQLSEYDPGTIDGCATLAWQRGYSVFALLNGKCLLRRRIMQAADWHSPAQAPNSRPRRCRSSVAGGLCWGGNDLVKAKSRGPSAGCTVPCLGNTSTICGGPWWPAALSIYSFPEGTGYSSEGCYADSSATRAVPTKLSDSNTIDYRNITVSNCALLAWKSGMSLFSLQNGGCGWVGGWVGVGVGVGGCGWVGGGCGGV